MSKNSPETPQFPDIAKAKEGAINLYALRGEFSERSARASSLYKQAEQLSASLGGAEEDIPDGFVSIESWSHVDDFHDEYLTKYERYSAAATAISQVIVDYK